MRSVLPPTVRLVLLVCAALTVASGTTLAPALPLIRDTFGAESWSRLFVTLPALAIAVSAPIVGRLTHRVGPRRVLLVALVLYATAGASGLVATGLVTLLVGRAAIGIAAAGLMTASTTLAALALEDHDARGRFFGQQASVMSLAGVVAIALGGQLAARHWRAPFLTYLLAAPILVLAARIDDIRAAQPAASAPPRARTVSPIHALTAVAMAFVFMVPLHIPFMFAPPRPGLAGLAVATASLFAAGSAALSARFRSDTSPLPWLARSLFVMCAGYLVVGSIGGTTAMFVGLAIAGVGSGWIMPQVSRWLVSTTDEASRGASIGLLTSAVYAGQFVSPFVTRLFRAETVASGFTSAGASLLVLAFALLGVRHAAQKRK